MAGKKETCIMKGKFIDDLDVTRESWICYDCARGHGGFWWTRDKPIVAYFGKCCVCGLVTVLSTVNDYGWATPEGTMKEW